MADKKAFVKSMKEKGIKNPPKSIAEFEKMMYTNPKEYYLINRWILECCRNSLGMKNTGNIMNV